MLNRSVNEAGDMHKSVVGGPASKNKGNKYHPRTYRKYGNKVSRNGRDSFGIRDVRY